MDKKLTEYQQFLVAECEERIATMSHTIKNTNYENINNWCFLIDFAESHARLIRKINYIKSGELNFNFLNYNNQHFCCIEFKMYELLPDGSVILFSEDPEQFKQAYTNGNIGCYVCITEQYDESNSYRKKKSMTWDEQQVFHDCCIVVNINGKQYSDAS